MRKRVGEPGDRVARPSMDDRPLAEALAMVVGPGDPVGPHSYPLRSYLLDDGSQVIASTLTVWVEDV